MQRLISYALIKYDSVTGEPVRDSSGLCIKAKGALTLCNPVSSKLQHFHLTDSLQFSEVQNAKNPLTYSFCLLQVSLDFWCQK